MQRRHKYLPERLGGGETLGAILRDAALKDRVDAEHLGRGAGQAIRLMQDGERDVGERPAVERPMARDCFCEHHANGKDVNPGALLFIGDGHALQADGEPLGNGLETSMNVEFSVDVRKKSGPSGPRVETSEHVISVGSQPEFASSLNRALQLATSDMVDWLVADYKLEPWAAHLLIGSQGRYDVVTVAGSMALRVPKKYLPARQ